MGWGAAGYWGVEDILLKISTFQEAKNLYLSKYP